RAPQRSRHGRHASRRRRLRLRGAGGQGARHGPAERARHWPEQERVNVARQVVRGISELYTPFDLVTEAAFAVDGERFVWVGRAADLPAEYTGWPVVDLGGS